ncbi:MAG TPA: HAD-IA family hydrolase [Ruminiclostridium sp.]|nr:HAD-IA family hydrolase [Ruminiclostridium sp.]
MGKVVVFDFDGVIINSSEVQKQALLDSYRLVVGEGYPSVDEFFGHSGDSLENIFNKMKLPAQMLGPYRKFSRENMKEIKVHEGMEDLLIQLRNKEVKCALCTGKDRERTLEILKYIGFINYFDVIVCSDDVTFPKPAPESLLSAMALLGESADNTVMVGDAKNDILCAKSAGVQSIAVSWGDTKPDILSKESPDFLVSDLKELGECLSAALNLRKKYLINDFVVAEDVCNMNCEYCLTDISEFEEKHKSSEKKSTKKYAYMEGEKLKSNIDKISRIIHCNFNTAILKVSGGELLTVKGIQEYIAQQSKKYKAVQVLTNGLLLNDELLDEYKRLGNICLQISIDHHTLSGNLYRTKNINVLNKILENIGKTVKYGIPLEINCVLTDRNTQVITDFADYLLQYKSGLMLYPFPIRGPLRDKFYPTAEGIAQIENLIENYSKYEGIMAPRIYLEYLYKFLKAGTRNVSCSLPRLAIGTFDDGAMTPCPNYWFTSLGNILEEDAEKVVSKVGTDKVYNLLSANRLLECKKCFTPWETLNLYMEGILSLDELCKSPLYGFPGIREYLVLLKKDYQSESSI